MQLHQVQMLVDISLPLHARIPGLVTLPLPQKRHQSSSNEQSCRQKHEDHIRLTLPAVSQNTVLDLLLTPVLRSNPAGLILAQLDTATVEKLIGSEFNSVVQIVQIACHALELDGNGLYRLVSFQFTQVLG
jgi:hypothetical protein